MESSKTNAREFCGVLHKAYKECVDRHGVRRCERLLSRGNIVTAYRQCTQAMPVHTPQRGIVTNAHLRTSHH